MGIQHLVAESNSNNIIQFKHIAIVHNNKNEQHKIDLLQWKR